MLMASILFSQHFLLSLLFLPVFLILYVVVKLNILRLKGFISTTSLLINFVVSIYLFINNNFFTSDCLKRRIPLL